MLSSTIPSLRQKQEFVLNQSLKLSLNLLRLQNIDLIEKINEEAQKNPLLILKTPKQFALIQPIETANETDTNWDDYVDSAKNQILNASLPKQQKSFLINLIQNHLDENLYIDKKHFLLKYNHQKYTTWRNYLYKISPPGLGAFNLQERFKIQLQYFGQHKSLAYKIIDECWNHFLSKSYNKISMLLKNSPEEIIRSLEIIQKFCHIHLISEHTIHNQHIYYQQPDLVLKDNNKVVLNEEVLPKISICSKYTQYLHTTEKDQKLFKHYISSARELIKALENRNKSIVMIAQTVIDLHQKHFTKTPFKMKKITLKLLCEYLPYSLSTISRALKYKTIITPHGIKMIGVYLRPLTSL